MSFEYMILRKAVFPGIFVSLVLLMSSGIFIPEVQAANMRVAVMISQDSEPYKETLAGFQQYLKQAGAQTSYDIYSLNASPGAADKAIQEIIPNNVDVLFTIGNFATEQAREHIRDIPIVAGMVLRDDGLRGADNVTGVFLEFPLEAQFRMMRRFFPDFSTVGVLFSRKENRAFIETASAIARNMGFRLVAEEVSLPRDIPDALEALLKSVDVMWGVTDSLVLAPQTSKQILLASYRYRIPFVGLSAPWTKAGAIYSLDRDYEDIGAQCAEMSLRIFRGAKPKAILPVPPRKVLYSINLRTAEQMKILLPEALVNGAYKVF